MRLIYKKSALSDLDGILTHIARDNPPAARRLGEGIMATADLFKSHPHMGSQRDDLGEGIRQFSHRGYGLYYLLDEPQRVFYLVRILSPRINVVSRLFD